LPAAHLTREVASGERLLVCCGLDSLAKIMPSQRWLHIIPVAFIMYTIAFVDRTNISLALPSMSRDLRMDPTQAGNAAGIFFWGYMLLQIPGGHLAERWSAKRFVSFLLVLWGGCSVTCGLVHTWRQFWAMRFLLGVAEGGVWPATLVLLAHWFPRAERARANAYWMLCLPAAVVVSSPLSGWILGRWNWRVLLIAEGALPFLWLLVWWRFIDDHPHQARWISVEERQFLFTTLRQEATELAPGAPEPYLRGLLRPQVLVMVGIYFLLNCGNYGYLFWLPSAMESARRMSNLQTGILFSIPFVLSAVGMVVVSRHSDKTRERRGHVALALVWSGVFLLASVFASNRAPALSFILISLVGAGSYGSLGPFWAIPTETLPASVAGSAMGLVNALGNLGGYFGPLVVGYLNQRTGNFLYAFGLLSAGWLLAAALTFLLRPRGAPGPGKEMNLP
jgi:MFS family permease